MNVPTKLAAFAAVLVLVFGGATLAGAAIDPTDEPATSSDHGAASEQTAGHGGAHDRADAQAPPASGAHGEGGSAASGLAVTDGQYTISFDRTHLAANRSQTLRLRITDARGRVVRDAFEVEHDKRLHLVVVRRDTKVFRHLHPVQQPDGSWTIDTTLVDPGVYRAYADFTIGGQKHTLATDLFVPGTFDPTSLPDPKATDRAVDDDGSPAARIDVALQAPGLRAGRETQLTFSASQNGRPLRTLEPYLGAKGHLVALREGDLAYLHVHPTESNEQHGGHRNAPAGPSANATTFAATFPTAGRYRLFLQFKVAGRVRTVDYTVEVPR